jgi:hypothetical protein
LIAETVSWTEGWTLDIGATRGYKHSNAELNNGNSAIR